MTGAAGLCYSACRLPKSSGQTPCCSCLTPIQNGALKCPHCDSLQDGVAWARCIVCKGAIHSGAQKCIHCESFQDWRSHFGFSAVVLSLLVALISVITASVPVLQRVATPNLADVRYAIVGCSTDDIRVLASNVGNRVAILTDARFEYIVDNQRKNSFPLQVQGQNHVLAPTQWVELTLTPADDRLLPKNSVGTRCEYRVTLKVRSLENDAALVSSPSTCVCPT